MTVSYTIGSWTLDHWWVFAVIALVAVGGFLSVRAIQYIGSDPYCTWQNGTTVKMIRMSGYCDHSVDRWIGQGYHVVRYGIEGSDYIVMEKNK